MPHDPTTSATREEVLRFVAFEDLRGDTFRTQFGSADWVLIHESLKGSTEDIAISAALLPRRAVDRALKNADWDLLQGHGTPGFMGTSEPGKPDVTTYHRFGNDSDIEPLILHRSFHGMRPRYLELCEEFRLFHNLFFDEAQKEFLKFAENGDPEIVVRMKPDRVEVHRRELMEYVTAKDMLLSLFVDRFRYGMIEPKLGESEKLVEDKTASDFVYHFHRSDARHIGYEDRNVFSRLLGKLLVGPSAAWAFNPWRRDEQFEEFIIGVDERGEPRLHSCDHELLANNFGANQGAPHYLTPVFFRREVLQRYYADPSRYQIEDSYLRCAGLWGLRMDNNHERYVIVWLGDLGRDLPAKERPYWKTFNVTPDGTISSTYFRRALLAKFAEPSAEDHVFKNQYTDTNKRWTAVYGWPLFRPLAAEDEHVAALLRIPLANSPSEFDEQVIALTKLLVDSLNEPELRRGVPQLPKSAKGIDKLEAFLRSANVEAAPKIVGFLRGLQALRSTGAAHRKGSNYEAAKRRFDVGSRPFPDVFRGMLREASQTLRLLGELDLDPADPGRS